MILTQYQPGSENILITYFFQFNIPWFTSLKFKNKDTFGFFPFYGRSISCQWQHRSLRESKFHTQFHFQFMQFEISWTRLISHATPWYILGRETSHRTNLNSSIPSISSSNLHSSIPRPYSLGLFECVCNWNIDGVMGDPGQVLNFLIVLFYMILPITVTNFLTIFSSLWIIVFLLKKNLRVSSNSSFLWAYYIGYVWDVTRWRTTRDSEF